MIFPKLSWGIRFSLIPAGKRTYLFNPAVSSASRDLFLPIKVTYDVAFYTKKYYCQYINLEAKEQYRSWMRKSDTWETLRVMCLGWQQMKCRGCDVASEHNHVHHIFYPKNWRKNYKSVLYLRVLCKKCHTEIHKLTNPQSYKKAKTAFEAYSSAIRLIRIVNGLHDINHFWSKINCPKVENDNLKIITEQIRKLSHLP